MTTVANHKTHVGTEFPIPPKRLLKKSMDTIRIAQYFTVAIPDEPGEAARVLGKLQATGVDLLVQTVSPASPDH